MLARWQLLPFHRKVIAQSLFTAIVALILAAVSSIIFNYYSTKNRVIDELYDRVAWAAASNPSAFVSGSEAQAQPILSLLQYDEQIIYAALFSADGELIAEKETNDRFRPPDFERSGEHRFRGDLVELTLSSMIDGEPVGYVYVVRNFNEVSDLLVQWFFVALGCSVLAFGLALSIALPLQRSMLQPVANLVAVAKRVSEQKDYKLRASVETRDELGELTLQFNSMLAEIENRDQQLSQSEALFRGITENTSDISIILNKELCCSYLSPAVERELGYNRSEIEGTRFTYYIHEAEAEVFCQVLNTAIASPRTTVTLEQLRFRRKDGGFATLECKITSLLEVAGINGIVINSREITDRLRAEEDRLRSQRHLKTFFELNMVGLAITDRNDRFILINDELCRMLGYSSEDIQGTDLQRLSHPDDLKREAVLLDEVIKGHRAGYSLDKRFVRQDGSFLESSTSVHATRNRRGELEYYYAVIQDISDRKRHERDMREAKESAESANRAKDEFLAIMSHELRTPMNSIVGFSELLENTEEEEERKMFTRRILDNSEYLLSLIEKILDYTRISSEKNVSYPRITDIRNETESIVQSLDPKSEGVDIQLVVDVDLPEEIVIDAVYYRQVVSNLLQNAIKFTDRGVIAIAVEMRNVSGNCQLGFTITDTGIGIPDEKLELIFEPFQQADTSNTRKYGGTGLGLAICRQLIQNMGGEIVCRSSIGQGATFEFSVPCTVAIPGENPAPPSTQESTVSKSAILSPPEAAFNQGKRILCAEDDASNRAVLQSLLKNAGHQTVIVENGKELLNILKQESFDAIIIDVQMPKMNGLEATRRIREGACGNDKRGIPIIGITAFAQSGDREKCIEAGMDGYLPKPVKYSALVNVLREV